MDTFLFMLGIFTLAFIYLGERFNAGVYHWIAILLSIIFALRMAEPMTYMATAGILAVLAYRTFFKEEDVRSTGSERNGS